MDLLLDTSTFLWVLWDSGQLSSRASDLFKDKNNRCYLSHVSVWEMTIKYRLGKLNLPAHPEQWIEKTCRDHDIAWLPIGLPAIYKLYALPSIHRDPFDRLLVAQALAHDLTICTGDAAVTRYDAKTIW